MTSCMISVIMGIYNCGDTLHQAIDSIINQTYDNWELIICDDGSKDDSYRVAEIYKEKYSERIKLIKNDRNMGLAYSLNRCLKHADGDLIARMDGDDISLPERFQMQVEFLMENKDFDLVGTAMRYFNEDNSIKGIVFKPEYPDYWTLRNRIPFNHATIVSYKTVFNKLEGYTVSERTKRAQDYDLWFRFYYHGFKGANIKDALYLVRENRDAIRRRTFSVRWNAFKTTLYGFKLLGYPRYWLIRPAILMILKSIIPYFFIVWYRRFQTKRDRKI